MNPNGPRKHGLGEVGPTGPCSRTPQENEGVHDGMNDDAMND